MTYFPAGQYHRQRRLNCCVRDGNRCRPSLMFTDKPIGPRFRGSTSRPKALRAPGNRTDEQTRTDLSMNSNSAWQGPGFLIEPRRRPLCLCQSKGPEPKGEGEDSGLRRAVVGAACKVCAFQSRDWTPCKECVAAAGWYDQAFDR
jgi:hypothetical protein